DRSYQEDGSLTPRGHANAMITDVEASIAQVKRMVMDGVVRSVQGTDVPVRADTLCIHGDQPNALAFAKQIRDELERAGVVVKPLAAAYPPGRRTWHDRQSRRKSAERLRRSSAARASASRAMSRS